MDRIVGDANGHRLAPRTQLRGGRVTLARVLLMAVRRLWTTECSPGAVDVFAAVHVDAPSHGDLHVGEQRHWSQTPGSPDGESSCRRRQACKEARRSIREDSKPGERVTTKMEGEAASQSPGGHRWNRMPSS